jgi:adenylyltransferase/sulfurtransferase
VGLFLLLIKKLNENSFKEQMFSVDELNRYSRHILLDEVGFNGQLLLRNARVLVVGAGGLGCPVLQYLTAAGIGFIGIVDSDIVDETNLQRQILYETADIGKSKAESAAQKLSKLNPFVNFKVFNTRFTKDNALDILSDYDIVVDGTDNFSARFLINDACVIQNKPFVYGGVYKFEGQVSVFNYNGGPTYRCLVSEQPENTEELNCSEVGVVGVIPGIVGCLQANEVLKIILGIGDPLSGKLMLIDVLRNQFSFVSIEKNPQNNLITELGQYNEVSCNVQHSADEISTEDLKKIISEAKDFEMIDIREKEDYNAFHIKGSINLPFHHIREKYKSISKNKTVIIICNYGTKSRQLIKYLNEEFGYTNLLNLKGGIIEWMKATRNITKQ